MIGKIDKPDFTNRDLPCTCRPKPRLLQKHNPTCVYGGGVPAGYCKVCYRQFPEGLDYCACCRIKELQAAAEMKDKRIEELEALRDRLTDEMEGEIKLLGRIAELEAKVKRLTSRGFEDLHYENEQLKARHRVTIHNTRHNIKYSSPVVCDGKCAKDECVCTAPGEQE